MANEYGVCTPSYSNCFTVRLVTTGKTLVQQKNEAEQKEQQAKMDTAAALEALPFVPVKVIYHVDGRNIRCPDGSRLVREEEMDIVCKDPNMKKYWLAPIINASKPSNRGFRAWWLLYDDRHTRKSNPDGSAAWFYSRELVYSLDLDERKSVHCKGRYEHSPSTNWVWDNKRGERDLYYTQEYNQPSYFDVLCVKDKDK
jgi:hypothetical protein